jgi:hypothetical protein
MAYSPRWRNGFKYATAHIHQEYACAICSAKFSTSLNSNGGVVSGHLETEEDKTVAEQMFNQQIIGSLLYLALKT